MTEKLIIGEDGICPITKLHCDDECCSVGAECNLAECNLSGNEIEDFTAEQFEQFKKDNDIELAKEQAKQDNYDFSNTRVHTDEGIEMSDEEFERILDEMQKNKGGRLVIGGTYEKIYQEIIANQEEVLCSPLRFTGVSIEKINQIFSNYGVDTNPKF
jgi:hypothetical protein